MSVDKLVDSTALDVSLTAIADAIRTKTGGSSQLVFPMGFVGGVNELLKPTGTKTITENGTNIDVANYSKVDVNVSGGGDIDDIIDNSVVSVVSDVATVEEYKFYKCTRLQTVELPECTFINGNAFRGCTALTSVKAYKAATIYGSAFYGVPCDALVFPNITGELGSSSLTQFKGTKVDLGLGGRSIKLSTFADSTNFNILVLRGSYMSALGNISAFNNTPFASGKAGGTLYVANSLISSYQSASNWSTILGYTNNQIKSIESTHTDPTAPIDLTLYYAD